MRLKIKRVEVWERCRYGDVTGVLVPDDGKTYEVIQPASECIHFARAICAGEDPEIEVDEYELHDVTANTQPTQPATRGEE